MDKRFLVILSALVVIFGGIFVVSQNSSDKSKNGSTSTQPSNHVIGEGSKNVTLVEYGDFQCPVCEAYEPVLGQVRSAYASDIYFQFRHLPLSSVHPNAFSAARATEAASGQNKFWEMHDALYDSVNWRSWTNSSSPLDLFVGYAKQIGLDEAQFRSDFASEKVNDSIAADLNEFKKTGQSSATPTFFLNGTYIENSKLSDSSGQPQFEKFKTVLDAEISKKSQQ